MALLQSTFIKTVDIFAQYAYHMTQILILLETTILYITHAMHPIAKQYVNRAIRAQIATPPQQPTPRVTTQIMHHFFKATLKHSLDSTEQSHTV